MTKEQTLVERIRDYWDGRAAGFADTRELELAGPKAQRWLAELLPLLGGKPLRILDAGTGTGFFCILLGKAGHRMTGIDLSPNMIAEARGRAARHGVEARWIVGDAMRTGLPAGSFDAVVTRNRTWTLTDLRAAYREWNRLLAPGGVLVNFDADYGAVSFSDITNRMRGEGIANAHQGLTQTSLDACDAITRELAVSRERRPDWDRQALLGAGFERISVDRALSERIYRERDGTYNPVPMFRIAAWKASRPAPAL